MKNTSFIIIIIFILALCVVCSELQAQQEQRNFGIAEVFRSGDSIFIKKLLTQVVNVSEGTVTKMRTPPDTAKLFIAPDGGIYEGVITWRKVGGTTPPPVFITEKVDGERATFSAAPNPVWSLHGTTAAPGWYGENNTRTIAFSNVAGSFFTYTFTGTKVELWAEKKTSHGTGTVSIDNGPVQPVSFIGPSALPVLIYSSLDLPIGVHTIRLTVVSGYSLLDYFIITKPQ